ncbi:MAG: aminoglycoside phosphotransferase family protein, partial [Acidimicrobiales bacterium]|nr:aminoglycoside phosphotransferase family protein [Acidimicrobiales bacterium]
RLPLPIPVPVRVGRPGAGYPWPWSIVAHRPGASALRTPPDDPMEAAATMGRFVAALARPAPPDAPHNPFRGIPLADRDDRTRAWIDQLSGLIDAPSVTSCWAEHEAIPRWTGEAVWLHGDLHPNNVIVDGGRITGIIDFGDLTAGDPATDLGVAWTLLAPEARPVLREALDVDDDTWARGRGWALSLGLAYLAHSADDPDFGRCGRATIDAVLADA